MQALLPPLSQWLFSVTRLIAAFSASGEYHPKPRNIRVVQVTFLSPQLLLHWHTKREGCVRSAEGWPL